jgi:hypothetical protein
MRLASEAEQAVLLTTPDGDGVIDGVDAAVARPGAHLLAARSRSRSGHVPFLAQDSTITTAQRNPSAIVHALFNAVENSDFATVCSVIADDVHIRFGNADPTDTKADFAAASPSFLGSIATLRQEPLEV